MKEKKITKGMKVTLVDHGWSSRDKTAVSEETIEKVGNKYFYLAGVGRLNSARFDVETLREVVDVGAPRRRCYLSLQEYEDQKELTRLNEKMNKQFGSSWSSSSERVELTLDQLRRINAIVEEK